MNINKETQFDTEFGNIKINIKEKMNDLKITKRMVINKTGLKNEVLNRYYYSDIKRMDIKVLAKICCALNCNISDLMCYEKDDK